MKENRKKEIIKLHRDSIIYSAEKLFMQKEYDKVTMDDISKVSEYSKRTLYVYFKNKEEIYNKIILRAMSMLKETIEKSLLSQKDILIRYEVLCDNLLNFYETYPIYFLSSIEFKSTTTNATNTSQEIIDIFNIGEEINLIVSNFLEEGIGANIFREDIEILPTIFVFWSSISSTVTFAINKQEYIKDSTGMDKNSFLKYSFKLLLNSIIK